MKVPKIFHATRARRELELAATAAFEDIASAIAAQKPELDRAECRRLAQFILEGTARQIREGQYVIVHHPDRLSQAPYDGDDFMELVRSLPKRTVISGHSDEASKPASNASGPRARTLGGLHITTLSDRTGRLSDQTGKRLGSDDARRHQRHHRLGSGQQDLHGRRGPVGRAVHPAAGGSRADGRDRSRWSHLPEGFHGARKLIKSHIQAIAETTQVASKEEMCWLAIAAATAWLPAPEQTMTASLADVAHGEP